MSIGIGLAFAAMPNLILEAVPPEETGRRPASTRWCVRSAPRWARRSPPPSSPAAPSARALPTDAGYTKAFLVGAGVALLAGVTAALIPSRSGRMARSAPATQAA